MFGKISKLLTSKAIGAKLRLSAAFSFMRDLQSIKQQLPEQPDFPITGYYPFLLDKYVESGQFVHHYFWQDLLIAQRIFHNTPTLHVDIGSRIDGFVAHVASFRPIEILDIRPLKREIPNVSFQQADLMQLPNKLINYTDSISSLHAIEHFGLGRYGDPIDINGHFKALENIHRILKIGGKFYFSVPIGKQGISFNAHRTFSLDYLVKFLEQKYSIDQFWFIDDLDILHTNKNIYSPEAASSFGCTFGCGLFELTKL